MIDILQYAAAALLFVLAGIGSMGLFALGVLITRLVRVTRGQG